MSTSPDDDEELTPVEMIEFPPRRKPAREEDTAQLRARADERLAALKSRPPSWWARLRKHLRRLTRR